MAEKQRRGFALLSPEQRRDVSAKGGRTVQASGKGRRWTREQASAAGHKSHAPKPAPTRLAVATGPRCMAWHPTGGRCVGDLGHYRTALDGHSSAHLNGAGMTWHGVVR